MRALVVPLVAIALSVLALARGVLPGPGDPTALAGGSPDLGAASADAVVVTGGGRETLRARGARSDPLDPGAVVLDDVRGTFPLAAGGVARVVAATARWRAGVLELGPGHVDAGDGALLPSREARWTPDRLDVQLTAGPRRALRLRR